MDLTNLPKVSYPVTLTESQSTLFLPCCTVRRGPRGQSGLSILPSNTDQPGGERTRSRSRVKSSPWPPGPSCPTSTGHPSAPSLPPGSAIPIPGQDSPHYRSPNTCGPSALLRGVPQLQGHTCAREATGARSQPPAVDQRPHAPNLRAPQAPQPGHL